jgi:predicted amidophosphoribosyltransferase
MFLALSEVGRAANTWALLGLLVAIVAMSGWGLWSWLRHRRAARQSAVRCPACRRQYPAGTAFCAVDGERLVGGEAPSVMRVGRGGRCPRCRRGFAAGIRFCPADGEELQPVTDWRGDDHAAELDHEHLGDHLVGGEGKICPVCASRYALEAQVCGRDGSELVTVN